MKTPAPKSTNVPYLMADFFFDIGVLGTTKLTKAKQLWATQNANRSISAAVLGGTSGGISGGVIKGLFSGGLDALAVSWDAISDLLGGAYTVVSTLAAISKAKSAKATKRRYDYRYNEVTRVSDDLYDARDTLRATGKLPALKIAEAFKHDLSSEKLDEALKLYLAHDPGKRGSQNIADFKLTPGPDKHFGRVWAQTLEANPYRDG